MGSKTVGGGPLGLIITVALLSVALTGWQRLVRYQQSFTILDRIDEIRRAELIYGAERPDHAFTCNGPDISGLKNIQWRANAQLGLRERIRI